MQRFNNMAFMNNANNDGEVMINWNSEDMQDNFM
jgi:hypothetical protein